MRFVTAFPYNDQGDVIEVVRIEWSAQPRGERLLGREELHYLLGQILWTLIGDRVAAVEEPAELAGGIHHQRRGIERLQAEAATDVFVVSEQEGGRAVVEVERCATGARFLPVAEGELLGGEAPLEGS